MFLQPLLTSRIRCVSVVDHLSVIFSILFLQFEAHYFYASVDLKALGNQMNSLKIKLVAES